MQTDLNLYKSTVEGRDFLFAGTLSRIGKKPITNFSRYNQTLYVIVSNAISRVTNTVRVCQINGLRRDYVVVTKNLLF